MTKIEKIAGRRLRAWRRWLMLRAVSRGVAERAWAWVLRWDVAYHEAQMTFFLDNHA